MSRPITTYLYKNQDEPIPMDRSDFYDEQIAIFQKTGKPTRMVAVAQVLLFTPDKQLIIQKRSRKKGHNVGLLDKTIGAHVMFGDTPFYTVMKAALQELSVPAFILDSAEDFRKTLRLLEDHTGRSAFVQFVDSKTVNIPKVIDGKEVLVGNRYYFFLGLYNGTLNPEQTHVSSVVYKDIQDLEREIEAKPEDFTEDIRFFLSKYRTEILHFLKQLT